MRSVWGWFLSHSRSSPSAASYLRVIGASPYHPGEVKLCRTPQLRKLFEKSFLRTFKNIYAFGRGAGAGFALGLGLVPFPIVGPVYRQPLTCALSVPARTTPVRRSFAGPRGIASGGAPNPAVLKNSADVEFCRRSLPICLRHRAPGGWEAGFLGIQRRRPGGQSVEGVAAG